MHTPVAQVQTPVEIQRSTETFESDTPLAMSVDGPTFTPMLLDDDRHLEGIGGWLILVALGVVLTPVTLLFSMVKTYLPLFTTPHIWEILQTQPRLHALVMFEAASNIIFFLISLALLYLFFQKKRSFPTFYIIFLVLHAVVLVADLVFAYIIVPNATMSPQLMAAALRSVVGAMVWIPYMLLSRRVKVTFVN